MRKLKTYLWLLSLSYVVIGCTNEEAILPINDSSDAETETVEETIEEAEETEPTTDGFNFCRYSNNTHCK